MYLLAGRARRVERKLLPIYLRKLGLRVRDARVERDIAASELAAASGVSVATIHRLETAKPRRSRGRIVGARVDTIIAIALALDLSPSELMP